MPDEVLDKRSEDIAAMLREGCSIADIMDRHRVAYKLIRRIRDDLGIATNKPGPRFKPAEPTNAHDRALFHRQAGNCWFCEAKLTDWVRMGDRSHTAAALCCKLCLKKWTPLIWDERAFANAVSLRALHPAGGILADRAIGGRYKSPDGEEVWEDGKGSFIFIGAEKSYIDKKFICFPT